MEDPQFFLLLSVLWRRLAENHAVLVESSVSPWRLAILGYFTSFTIFFAVLFVVCLLEICSKWPLARHVLMFSAVLAHG